MGKKTKKKAPVKKARKGLGRPRKYTAAQAQKLIDEYFKKCDDEKKPYTITGLAVALDTSRKTLCEWAGKDDEIGNAIKKAKTLVEQSVEEALLSGANPGGYIFWLKNFGWADRHEITGAGGGPIDIVARIRAGRDRLAKRKDCKDAN